MLLKSKIAEPKTDKNEERQAWINKNYSILQKVYLFKRNALLLIFIIPIGELLFHFLIGEYELNGQLLTAGFFVLFYISLLIALYAVQGKKSDRIEKKYTWKSGIQL
ncbi:MAG: hypothetical protein ABJG68_13305 [Crocinitomicaceae bacterium]